MRVITVRKHTRRIQGKKRPVLKKKRDSRLGKRVKKPKRKVRRGPVIDPEGYLKKRRTKIYIVNIYNA